MRTITTILALLAALVIGGTGLLKLLSAGHRADQSDLYEIGGSQIPSWFFLLVGAFEVLVALMLIVPRTRMLAGLGLLLTMAGAFLFNSTLASDSEGASGAVPEDFLPVNVVLGALGLLITLLWMWIRRSDKKAASKRAAAAAAAAAAA